jgi:hypothetical protein
MIASVERLRQLARRTRLLTATPMLLVIAVPSPRDPITKRTGAGVKGAVLPIPAAPATGLRVMHLDSLLSGHRDSRTERGRVLYAPGHAPRDTAAAPRPTHKSQCPVQRVVAQGARAAAGPAT